MLNTYEVSAVFVGHYHGSVGLRPHNGVDYGNVPVFGSGSASQSTFLVASFSGSTLTVESMSSKSGRPSALGRWTKPLRFP